jgi:hypothetical protein
MKSLRVGEKYQFELRGEALNILDHAPRRIQLALKFLFQAAR